MKHSYLNCVTELKRESILHLWIEFEAIKLGTEIKVSKTKIDKITMKVDNSEEKEGQEDLDDQAFWAEFRTKNEPLISKLNEDLERLHLWKVENDVSDTSFSEMIDEFSKEVATPSFLLEMGIEFVKKSKFDDAILLFTGVIKLEPTNAEAYFQRGSAKVSIDDVSGAIDDLTKARNLDASIHNPFTLWTAYYIRGLDKCLEGAYAGAIEDFTLAIETDPQNAGAYIVRGRTKMDFDDFEEAIEDFETAMILEPQNPDCYLQRGIAKSHLNDSLGAIEDFTICLMFRPDSGKAYYLRGCEKYDCGYEKSALLDLEKAAEMQYEDAIDYLKEIRG